jgi:5-hydroxyisourate hydrolase-like protein (transthyretin family)
MAEGRTPTISTHVLDIVRGGEAPFFIAATIDFQVADTGRHYHVPLLPRYSCASYRGS